MDPVISYPKSYQVLNILLEGGRSHLPIWGSCGSPLIPVGSVVAVARNT